jgi:glycosyltransferase involved in cell wall biosynthesis
MRVLYVLRYFPTLTETFVNQEISQVSKLGIDVSVATLGTRPDGALQDMVPEVPIHRVPRRPLGWQLRKMSPGQRWLTTHQRRKDAARLPGLSRIAASMDRIHVHFAGEAAELAHALHLDLGLPYTVMVHATDLFKPRPSLSEVLGRAERVLTISRHNQATLAAMGVQSHLVRCGPSLERIQPTPMPEGPLKTIFIGRRVPKKGLDTLLEAWSGLDLPGAALTLVTDKGPDAPPPGVTELGLRPTSEIPALLAQHHLLCLPCRRAPDGDMDGVPLVLMEALAAGRPVLTTPISGIAELVDNAVGWLIPADDPRALRKALTSVAADLPSAGRKGAAGPQRLRERGYHLQAQVQGVVSAWGIDEPSAPGMAANRGEVE